MSPLPASTKVEQMQPVVDATSTAASPEADLLGKLAAVGIDYSVAEADIEDWIVNIYTPYPAFAGALLNLLKDRVLRKPVSQCIAMMPSMAFHSDGLIRRWCATRTECSGPSSLRPQ